MFYPTLRWGKTVTSWRTSKTSITGDSKLEDIRWESNTGWIHRARQPLPPPLVLEKEDALVPLDQDPVWAAPASQEPETTPCHPSGGLTSAEGWGYLGTRGTGKVIILEFKIFLYPQCLNLWSSEWMKHLKVRRKKPIISRKVWAQSFLLVTQSFREMVPFWGYLCLSYLHLHPKFLALLFAVNSHLWTNIERGQRQNCRICFCS